MSPPAHLMLRGLPQRVASLELAWHTARRQRHIHATECLRTPQSCQPVKANAMAEPPAHALATSQRNHSPPLGWLWLVSGTVWKENSARSKPMAGGWRRRCIIDERDLPLAFRGAWLPSASPGKGNNVKTTDATLITGVALLHHQLKSAKWFYKPTQC